VIFPVRIARWPSKVSEGSHGSLWFTMMTEFTRGSHSATKIYGLVWC